MIIEKRKMKKVCVARTRAHERERERERQRERERAMNDIRFTELILLKKLYKFTMI